jgi:hypothetical protein
VSVESSTSHLERKFEGCDSLKLQDLTANSIAIYVHEQLQQNPDFLQFLAQRQQEFEPERNDTFTPESDLAMEILRKAQGVFLLVKLAVSEILDGVLNLDSWDDLFLRLKEIPEELEEVYDKMWCKCQK